MQYEIGDIVFASEAIKNSQNDTIKSHLFVIIDDDGTAVSAEYFGFVISSNLNKSKENSKYKYNEIINKNNINNLKKDSIVKCDELLSIPSENIHMKIGVVNNKDLLRFLDAFDRYLSEI